MCLGGEAPGEHAEPVGKPPTSQIATARTYGSADEYAEAMNAYASHPTDPPHIKDRDEQEFQRLKALWNLWKQIGLI
jgi:hypothetical protein